MANAALMLAKTHAVCCGVVPVLTSVGLGGLIGDSLETKLVVGACLLPVAAAAGLGVEKGIHYVMHKIKPKKKSCDHDHKVFTWRNYGKQALAGAAGLALITGYQFLTADKDMHHDCDHDHNHGHKTEFHAAANDTCDHAQKFDNTIHFNENVMTSAQDSVVRPVMIGQLQVVQ